MTLAVPRPFRDQYILRQALRLQEQALPHRSLGRWVLCRRLQLHAVPCDPAFQCSPVQGALDTTTPSGIDIQLMPEFTVTGTLKALADIIMECKPMHIP